MIIPDSLAEYSLYFVKLSALQIQKNPAGRGFQVELDSKVSEGLAVGE